MRTVELAKVLTVAVAASAAMIVLPAGAALADTCGDGGTTKIFDPAASFFDFTDGGATADRDTPFATLYDGGGNGPLDSPVGPRNNSDAFDNWGALFVGGTSVADMYFSADNNSCANAAGGAEHIYPVVPLHGLLVQRKMFVRPNSEVGGLPGVRILDLFSNPGATAVTTTVQVGDNLSADDNGDLGSDDDTAVRSSSSGDAAATAGDKWFVTSDHTNTGGTENSDPALAFVVDGPTGLNTAASIQVGGGTDADPADNLIWTRQITVQPGETVAVMSFVVQADVATGGANQAAEADALAVSRAQAYQNAPASQLYEGMSAAEIAALINWNDLQVKGQIGAAKKQKLRKKFSAVVTCPEEACTVDLGGVLKIGKKKFKLKTAHKQLTGGVATKVTVKLRKKTDLAKAAALLARNPGLAKKAKVVFRGTVTDLTKTAHQSMTTSSKLKR